MRIRSENLLSLSRALLDAELEHEPVGVAVNKRTEPRVCEQLPGNHLDFAVSRDNGARKG